MSGRKGLGVKIDDLLDLLTDKAAAEVGKRNPEFTRRRAPAGRRRRSPSRAIRYFMLKFSRGKLIVFDIEEALSFEGETGPYLQYAAVRANNILQKLREREGLSEADCSRRWTRRRRRARPASRSDCGRWCSKRRVSTKSSSRSSRSLEFSVLAKYAFGLAQLFNAFYHRYPILNEERADRKRWRAAGVGLFPRRS